MDKEAHFAVLYATWLFKQITFYYPTCVFAAFFIFTFCLHQVCPLICFHQMCSRSLMEDGMNVLIKVLHRHHLFFKNIWLTVITLETAQERIHRTSGFLIKTSSSEWSTLDQSLIVLLVSLQLYNSIIKKVKNYSLIYYTSININANK